MEDEPRVPPRIEKIFRTIVREEIDLEKKGLPQKPVPSADEQGAKSDEDQD